MSNLEEDLRRTLRRKPAPDHLADEIIARIEGQKPSKSAPATGKWRRMAMAALAVFALGSGALFWQQLQSQPQQEMAAAAPAETDAAFAKAQVLLALHIASRQTHLVFSNIRKISPTSKTVSKYFPLQGVNP